MTSEEYDKRLHLLLGVIGPVSHRLDGVVFLTYKLPDGSCKDLPCPQDMSPAQRIATLEALMRHLNAIKRRRQVKGF